MEKEARKLRIRKELSLVLFAAILSVLVRSALSQTPNSLDDTIKEQRDRAQQSIDETTHLLNQDSSSLPEPPRVYFEAAPGYPSLAAQRLRSQIENMKIDGQRVLVPTTSTVRDSPLLDELRFFHRADAAGAALVAKGLSDLIPHLVISDLSPQYEHWAGVGPKRYELWLRLPSDVPLTDDAIIARRGRWTVGTSSAQCQSKWYLWTVAEDYMLFTDQSKQTDREKILNRSATGFLTEVLESVHLPPPQGTPSETVGQRWEYRPRTTSSFAIQRVPAGSGFALTKC
jgi:hypothetical protein